MLYGYDLLDGFSSVEKLCWDDVFAESVLGSQRNKEELDRFAFLRRVSDGEGKQWLNHL